MGPHTDDLEEITRVVDSHVDRREMERHPTRDGLSAANADATGRDSIASGPSFLPTNRQGLLVDDGVLLE